MASDLVWKITVALSGVGYPGQPVPIAAFFLGRVTPMSIPTESSRRLSLRYLLPPLAVWIVAMFGTLQIHQFEGILGHAICGPWGCGPPVAALLGYHGFWWVLLLLPAWVMKHRFTGMTLRRLGNSLCLLAVVGIVVLLTGEGWQFWQREANRQFFGQWCLFRLATFVDFPFVQLGAMGLWLRHPRPGGTANPSRQVPGSRSGVPQPEKEN